jgi:hypothetical protein
MNTSNLRLLRPVIDHLPPILNNVSIPLAQLFVGRVPTWTPYSAGPVKLVEASQAFEVEVEIPG